MDLLIAYSKRLDLISELVNAVARLRGNGALEPERGVSVRSEQPPRVWRVCDRLSETDVCGLVASYRAGMNADVLAEQFKISESSVKRLLREHKARRQDNA